VKFLHLTDLHITTPGHMLFGQCPNDVVRRAVDIINREHGDAELCVVTGDITHNGTAAEYAVAAEILGALQIPLHMTVGNHDSREAARAGLPGLVWHPDGFAQGVVETSIGPFLILDTKIEGTHGGAFCDARAAWLRARLGAYAGQAVRVFMHHAPMSLGLPAMDTIAMNADGEARLAEAFRAHGAVQHIFFGHFHRPVSGVWQGIPISSHRSMMLQCALDFQTADDVPGIFEEPQIAVVLADADTTLVHYHDFDSSAAIIPTGAPES